MATGATNGIPTARELENTGAFSFNTTNANVLSYVPSLDMCPTRQTILAAIKSGYGAEISTTYSNRRLVPYNAIQWQKNLGKLTITLQNGEPPYSLNHYMMMPIKYSTNISYLPSTYTDLYNLSDLGSASVDTFTSTSVTIYCYSWDAYTQNMRIYYSWESYYAPIYLYGNVTSSQLSSLKNGTNITVNGYWTTSISSS